MPVRFTDETEEKDHSRFFVPSAWESWSLGLLPWLRLLACKVQSSRADADSIPAETATTVCATIPFWEGDTSTQGST